MYKKIFACSNCGTEFIEDVEIDDFDKKVENLSTDFICFKDSKKWNVYHKCIGGEIGMKVFKCFREVKE